MESQPQNPEFRNNPENFHPCIMKVEQNKNFKYPIFCLVWSLLRILCQNTLVYSKTCVKGPLKNRQNKNLNDKRWLNDGRKYCRMLPLEHSVILLNCIKP